MAFIATNPSHHTPLHLAPRVLRSSFHNGGEETPSSWLSTSSIPNPTRKMPAINAFHPISIPMVRSSQKSFLTEDCPPPHRTVSGSASSTSVVAALKHATKRSGCACRTVRIPLALGNRLSGRSRPCQNVQDHSSFNSMQQYYIDCGITMHHARYASLSFHRSRGKWKQPEACEGAFSTVACRLACTKVPD